MMLVRSSLLVLKEFRKAIIKGNKVNKAANANRRKTTAFTTRVFVITS